MMQIHRDIERTREGPEFSLVQKATIGGVGLRLRPEDYPLQDRKPGNACNRDFSPMVA